LVDKLTPEILDEIEKLFETKPDAGDIARGNED